MYTLKVEGAFEAAHRVVNYPGKCDRLHGHNWKVEAVVRGTKLDELGMLVDFKAEELAKSDAFVRDSELFAITVYETPTSSVTYTRD